MASGTLKLRRPEGWCANLTGSLWYKRIKGYHYRNMRLSTEGEPGEVRAVSPLVRGEESSFSTTIRILAFMEASCVTGPAKNLIEFARRAAQIQPPLLRACITIATFQRGKSQT